MTRTELLERLKAIRVQGGQARDCGRDRGRFCQSRVADRQGSRPPGPRRASSSTSSHRWKCRPARQADCSFPIIYVRNISDFNSVHQMVHRGHIEQGAEAQPLAPLRTREHWRATAAFILCPCDTFIRNAN